MLGETRSKKITTPRKLIPNEKIVVVLDTSPVRNLAYGETPDWVSTFAEMVGDGYMFSLADTTVAELLTQARSKRIPEDGYRRMISSLKKFLDPIFPMLPGKIDLEAIIGLDDTVNLEETKFLSKVAWDQLLNPNASVFALGPPLDTLLEEERDEWVSSLNEMRMTTYFHGIDLEKSDPDEVAEFMADIVGRRLEDNWKVIPSMEVRMHLELRYRFRQMARSAQKKNSYNPENKKNRNDGIDVDIYKYFILPALAVATDGGFFESLCTIESFQRNWFYRPEELAAEWIAGKRPQPIWPDADDSDDLDDPDDVE